MAAAKPDILIIQLVGYIETRFQRLLAIYIYTQFFLLKDFIEVKADTVRHGWKWENQHGGRQTGYTYNSVSMHTRFLVFVDFNGA